jgi:hypothetical protein
MKQLLTALAFLLVAAPAAALEVQTFTRTATAPHVPTLAVAISPSLVPGSVHVNVVPNGANYIVVIGATSWAGVTLSAVQAAVDAAPADTAAVRAKAEKASASDTNQCVRRAIAEVLLDEVNVIRANIAAASLTPRTLTQMNTAIDNKIDALGCN